MRHPFGICLTLLCFVNAGGASEAARTDGPATIWQMENSARIGGHASIVLGAPQAQMSGKDKGIHFNGISDGLLVPVNPVEGLQQFTIEVLFKPETGGTEEQRFLHIQDELGSRVLMEIRLLDKAWALDTFLYSLKTESQHPMLDRTKLHPADRWTWVALVYANGHMAHYIDGVKELEGSVDFPPMLAGQISLGVRQNKVYWFKGSMREVRFHPEALTPEKLQRTE